MILSYIFINHPWILPNVVSWKSEKLQNSFVNKVKRTGIHHITDGFFLVIRISCMTRVLIFLWVTLNKKWSFPLWIFNSVNVTKSAMNLITFTEEILNGKLHLLCSVKAKNGTWHCSNGIFEHKKILWKKCAELIATHSFTCLCSQINSADHFQDACFVHYSEWFNE